MHNAYIGGHSENNIKCVVRDDLGWKNQTTCYNCRFSATSLALRVVFSGGTTEQHVIIAGFAERAAVDYNT